YQDAIQDLQHGLVSPLDHLQLPKHCGSVAHQVKPGVAYQAESDTRYPQELLARRSAAPGVRGDETFRAGSRRRVRPIPSHVVASVISRWGKPWSAWTTFSSRAPPCPCPRAR